MSLGFYYDQTSCIGCKACQVACKDKNGLDMGVLFRRISDYETGTYPAPGVFYISRSCNHCAAPACMAACPVEAISKTEDGVVLIDPAICNGCQSCVTACPYGVPVMLPSTSVAGKCDSCIQLRENGETNACVGACSMRALDFGELEELKSRHGGSMVDALPPYLPEGGTGPSLVISPKEIATRDGAAAMVY
jgi:anaerobic dimethyl sulfoxide reductase subunit B (iron-sulfur subunit)